MAINLHFSTALDTVDAVERFLDADRSMTPSLTPG
jgi:hypothetical protein